MKILHLSRSDLDGGAAIASYRIHEALKQSGIDSKMVVGLKLSDDKSVIGPQSKLDKTFEVFRPALDRLPQYFSKNRKSFFSNNILSNSRVKELIAEHRPDIVHIHWINSGFLSINSLSKLHPKIVWTFQDMWPLTGGCHYDEDCNRYIDQCGMCPLLNSKCKYDLSSFNHWRKRKSWENFHPQITVTTKWMEDCTKRSSLFKNHSIEVIPNTLDENVFVPVEKSVARKIFKLDNEKRYLLFGAVDPTSSPRKGFRYIQEALTLLSKNENLRDVELVIFGASEGTSHIASFKCNYVGKIFDARLLAILYSSADVMLAPSIQEAFGQTLSEALACGLPVVTFDATGPIDIVDHKETGYRAKLCDSEDLANGILWSLNTKGIKELARARAIERFGYRNVAKSFIKIYERVLGSNG